VAATLILLPFDQKLIDNSRELGERWEWIKITTITKLEVYLKFQKISDLPLSYRKRFYIGLLGIGFGTYGLLKMITEHRLQPVV
jgi:hypothetical protein